MVVGKEGGEWSKKLNDKVGSISSTAVSLTSYGWGTNSPSNLTVT